jgi:hypothetical protein
MKEGGIFKADAEYNERKNKNGVYRDKMRVLLFFSEMIIPLILFYVVGFGVLMKCDIYEEFVKGAKEGLETVIQILPTLIGLMVIFDHAWRSARKGDRAVWISVGFSTAYNCADVFFKCGNRAFT